MEIKHSEAVSAMGNVETLLVNATEACKDHVDKKDEYAEKHQVLLAGFVVASAVVAVGLKIAEAIVYLARRQ